LGVTQVTPASNTAAFLKHDVYFKEASKPDNGEGGN